MTHLSILQSGLASSDLVQDCLAVAKVEKYFHQNILIFPKYFQGQHRVHDDPAGKDLDLQCQIEPVGRNILPDENTIVPGCL